MMLYVPKGDRGDQPVEKKKSTTFKWTAAALLLSGLISTSWYFNSVSQPDIKDFDTVSLYNPETSTDHRFLLEETDGSLGKNDNHNLQIVEELASEPFYLRYSD